MRSVLFLSGIFSFSLTLTATAQVVPIPTNSVDTYVAVISTCDNVSGSGNNFHCLAFTQGVPLGYFATTNGVNSQVTALGSQVTDLRQQLSDTNAYVAAVGAMHDAIPDAGDRFAVRLNSAAVNGVVAAGASFSASLGDGFRASVNYAGARGQNTFSGGLNFSFH